jgi:hypothetical protein
MWFVVEYLKCMKKTEVSIGFLRRSRIGNDNDNGCDLRTG